MPITGSIVVGNSISTELDAHPFSAHEADGGEHTSGALIDKERYPRTDSVESESKAKDVAQHRSDDSNRNERCDLHKFGISRA